MSESDGLVIALRRELALWRLAVVITAMVALGVFAVGRLRREVVVVVDLQNELARLSALPNVIDMSRTFYATESATVHLHVMGRTQRCPLHIHPTHGELTAIVGGTAEVSQVAPSHGALARTTATFAPGDLIYSPAFCGHEWVNTSSDQLLGNLVLAAPVFSGNLYVTENDARMMKSGAPITFRVDDELTAFRKSGQTTVEKSLTLLAKRLRLVVTTREFEIRPAAGTIVLFRSGRGSMRARGRTSTIGPSSLAVLKNHRGATVTPAGKDPLLFLIFDAD